jgi:hypothetical protein
MVHEFEFVVVKHPTTPEAESEALHLIYKTKSNRKNKVAELIKDELEKKEIVERKDIKDFYLKQIK